METTTIEETNCKSFCCDAFVHYKVYKYGDFTSKSPFCTKCLKWPATDWESVKKNMPKIMKELFPNKPTNTNT